MATTSVRHVMALLSLLWSRWCRCLRFKSFEVAAKLAPMALIAPRRGSQGSDASEDELGHSLAEELKNARMDQSKLEEELKQVKESATKRESCKR